MSESSKRHSKFLSLIFILKCLSKVSVIRIFLFHPLFHTLGSCPSLRAIKVSIWWSREKSRESCTLLRGAEKKGPEAAARACVLSRLASLAK